MPQAVAYSLILVFDKKYYLYLVRLFSNLDISEINLLKS